MGEALTGLKRSCMCCDVNENMIGKEVTVMGWVQRRRDLGQLIFIALRDKTGLVQIAIDGNVAEKDLFAKAESVRSEFVLAVKGQVAPRTEGNINPNMKTGTIEIIASEIRILSEAETTPFQIEDNITVKDDLRLKYRYLDLRRPSQLKNLVLRHKVVQAMRNFLDQENFLEIETPILGKSTPEGARDYLVPSRVHPGNFYGLPQSPQLYKQLLMVSGMDRYYQVAKCFRDEDLRADRQPEFTQVDIETTFLTAEEIQTYTEGLIAKVMKEVRGIEVALPFPRMTYDEAMARYGSDKPDTRFEMELIDLSETVKEVEFKVFQMALENGGVVKALNAKGAADRYSRKDMDQLGQYVGQFGAKGLAWLKVDEDGLKGPIAKFMVEATEAIIKATDAEPGDLLMFGADKSEIVAAALGAIRTRLGKELGLIDESKFNFLWVTDWPQFEFSEEEGRYVSAHHPFTMPKAEDIPLLAEDPAKVYAEAYDIVLNGYELGGGSIRIHTRELQEKVLKTLGFTKEQMEEQFGFLLTALDYGFPPHGGIALGLDRFAMLLAGEDNIREVIAFPKNGKAADVMSDAPSMVSPLQLFELNIDVTNIEE